MRLRTSTLLAALVAATSADATVLWTDCTPSNAPEGPDRALHIYQVYYDTASGEFIVKLPKRIVHYKVVFETRPYPYIDVTGTTNTGRVFYMQFQNPASAKDGILAQTMEIITLAKNKNTSDTSVKDSCGLADDNG
jgi:hypothetical protein